MPESSEARRTLLLLSCSPDDDSSSIIWFLLANSCGFRCCKALFTRIEEVVDAVELLATEGAAVEGELPPDGKPLRLDRDFGLPEFAFVGVETTSSNGFTMGSDAVLDLGAGTLDDTLRLSKSSKNCASSAAT